MRPEVRISFWGHRIPGGAQTILGPAGCGPDVTAFSDGWMPGQVDVEVTLLDTDERVPRLRALIEQYGEPFTEIHEDRYSDEELESARLLVLMLNRKCEVDGGSKFGTTYDLSGACPSCGAGARQSSALFLDGKDDELPKLKGHRAGATYGDDVFVDDRIAAELDALAPTGLVFHQVYALMPDTNRQVKLPYKQLSADRVLPPMAPQTEGMANWNDIPPCPICRRSGYWGGPCFRVAYRKRDLEGAGDVNLTWEGKYGGEITGNPREWGIPVPWLLVTPKVMRVFRAAGVTEFEWIPIRVVDE